MFLDQRRYGLYLRASRRVLRVPDPGANGAVNAVGGAPRDAGDVLTVFVDSGVDGVVDGLEEGRLFVLGASVAGEAVAGLEMLEMLFDGGVVAVNAFSDGKRDGEGENGQREKEVVWFCGEHDCWVMKGE